MTGYDGEIKVNKLSSDELCHFDSNVYKVKNCLSDCKSEQGHSTSDCNEKCSVPI